jgi:hypothetical protein
MQAYPPEMRFEIALFAYGLGIVSNRREDRP